MEQKRLCKSFRRSEIPKPLTPKAHMLSIEIHSDANTEGDLAEMLRHIADQVEQGYVQGHEPAYEVSGVEEPYEEE